MHDRGERAAVRATRIDRRLRHRHPHAVRAGAIEDDGHASTARARDDGSQATELTIDESSHLRPQAEGASCRRTGASVHATPSPERPSSSLPRNSEFLKSLGPREASSRQGLQYRAHVIDYSQARPLSRTSWQNANSVGCLCPNKY